MTETARLAQLLAPRLQAVWETAAEITGIQPLAGGASRESWGVQVRMADGAERRLILLRDSGRSDRDRDVAVEAAAMVAVRAAGVPVPELYDHGQEALGRGRAYLLMERLDGETIPRRLLRDEAYAAVRPQLARRLGEILARIHRVDPGSVPGLPRIDALSQVIGLYQDFAEPRPALEIGLRWLAAHRPPASAEALVHGDFRTGNLIVGSGGLRGVLDWELAHRGGPMHDLGWLCTKAWRFGSANPVGGFGARADLMSGYAEGGGLPPDEATQRWWELYGTVRWALLCRRQAPVQFTDPLEDTVSPATAPHDQPTGPDLLRAVREFLATEVAVTDPRLAFHARVAANALRIAEREAMLAPGQARDHRARLAALGCADDAELCAAIRDGSLDHRFDDVIAAVRATTIDKLAVANPGHLARPG
jgi:aminoglycoside phosphotransferase (APT) family kinase protein